MANRFYIPPGRNPGIDYANLALGLMNIQQRGKIAKGYQDVARERTAVAERGVVESERVGKIRWGHTTPGSVQGVPRSEAEGGPGSIVQTPETIKGLEERRIEAMESAAANKTWLYGKVNKERFMNSEADLKTLKLYEELQPINKIAREAIAMGASRIDLYSMYRSNPIAFMETKQSLEDSYAKAKKKGDEVQMARIMTMYSHTDMDTFLDAKLPGARQELEGKTVAPERMYETEEGWQPRSEAIGKLKPEKPEKPFETPTEKRTIEERRRLEDDIVQTQQKIASLQAGQDIMSEALGSERETAISDLQKRLSTMNTQYEKLGGNLSRVGGAIETAPAPTTDQDQAVDVKVGTVIINDKTGERKRWNGKEWAPIK